MDLTHRSKASRCVLEREGAFTVLSVWWSGGSVAGVLERGEEEGATVVLSLFRLMMNVCDRRANVIGFTGSNWKWLRT